MISDSCDELSYFKPHGLSGIHTGMVAVCDAKSPHVNFLFDMEIRPQDQNTEQSAPEQLTALAWCSPFKVHVITASSPTGLSSAAGR